MENKEYVKEITNIEKNFARWYTDIVLKAELADYTDTKGCIAIRPYGYAIWENIQNYADQKFKEVGITNLYMPLLIPESLLNMEKEHVEGFAPEVAWVTHYGEEKLEERLFIRPTSETIIGHTFAKWVNSWRDLPIKVNQWCNVLRCEKTTRPFLRTAEFLWQEGHTLHLTLEEAEKMSLDMLDIYVNFAENVLAMPVIKGRKTESEKFAGGDVTYTFEPLMHDGKALQGGTSHVLGQNFAKAFDITYQSKDGSIEYPYQTSWGISTRLIGAIIMTHGDNRGLKLPPRIAPTQVIIVPIAAHKEGVIEKCNELKKSLENQFRVELDDRDNYTPGYKFNDCEMRGIPVRLEMGPRDIENGVVVAVRRDTGSKEVINIENLNEKLEELLEDIQANMYNMAKENMDKRTNVAVNMDEFKKALETNQGFIKAMWCGNEECEAKIKAETAATTRCMPFEQEHISDTCVCCGKKAEKFVYFARAY